MPPERAIEFKIEL
jgi:hypothetical protein